MTQPVLTGAPAPQGLLARALGVVFSPRDTYARLVPRPKVLGAMLAVAIVMAGVNYLFLSTPIGQQAWIDQQLTARESFGVQTTDQMLAGMERMKPYAATLAACVLLISVPIVMVVMAGIVIVVFNAIMGGDASFKQILSIVAHSAFIGALQQLFVMPLNYYKQSMSSATSLSVFLPMLDDRSFLGMLAGSLDFFRIWSTVSLAIGLAVLYKRRTAPIAWSLLAVFFVVVLVFAGVRAALSGA